MRTLLAILVGIPLAVELLGAVCAIRDGWSQPDARAAAVERLAVPMLMWGLLWWIAGATAGPVLSAVLVGVALWQFVAFAVVRLLSRWRRFQTVAEDTDAIVTAVSSGKKSPGDSGDWGGERQSPGR